MNTRFEWYFKANGVDLSLGTPEEIDAEIDALAGSEPLRMEAAAESWQGRRIPDATLTARK